MTTDVAPNLQAEATDIVRELVHSVRGLRGALLASVDGRPVASVLRDHDAGSTAAIIASSRGLGERLAELSGEGTLEEIVVRSSAGYVVIYAAGRRGVLTVLTESAANLAMLHLRARDVAGELARLLERLDDGSTTG